MSEEVQPTQQELLPSAVGAVFFEPEREYTAMEVEEKRPELVKACLALLAQGAGVLRIAKALQMHPRTVMALRRKYMENVEIEKKELSNLSRDAARLCAEHITEKLSGDTATSIKDLGITLGILVEKSELLSGQPTARVEIAKATEDHQAYIDLIEQPPATGLAAERKGQKEDVIRYGPVSDRAPGAKLGQVCGENSAPEAAEGQETPQPVVEVNEWQKDNSGKNLQHIDNKYVSEVEQVDRIDLMRRDKNSETTAGA